MEAERLSHDPTSESFGTAGCRGYEVARETIAKQFSPSSAIEREHY